MHFPYSSRTKGASQGMRGDGPVDGRPVAHTKCAECAPACVPWRDSGAPVDCGSPPQGLSAGVLLCLTAEGREL